MKKCIHPECEKAVYYRAALTCKEHKTMPLKCDWCKKEYQLPYSRWIKCKDRIHFCSPSCQTAYHNTTDVMRKASSNRMKAYHNSLSEEERRQRAIELNKLSQTEEHFKALAKHCHEMNQTEKHKLHLQQLNSVRYEFDSDGNIVSVDGKDIYSFIKFSIEGPGLYVNTLHGQNDRIFKQKSAFDQILVNLGIGWFAYIKFTNDGRPWVYGKSGTKLVSKGVNDIAFWEKEKGHPSVNAMRQLGLTWDKTKVYIIPCNSEEEALEKELELKNSGVPFGC